MAKLLWQPSEARVEASNMNRFMHHINDRFDQDFSDYNALYQWSIDNIDQCGCDNDDMLQAIIAWQLR